jgi:tyrosine-protein kinase
MDDVIANRPTTLADYVAILRRRAWIVILVPLVAAFVAFKFSASQPPLYAAQAKVLVNRSSGVVSGVTAGQDPTAYDPVRFLMTQAKIARSPALARRVVAAAGIPGITAAALLGSSSVSPETDADLLDISVSAPNPNQAVLLANAYAHGFARYKTELDTARITEALGVLKARAKTLEKRGETTSIAYQTLLQYQGQLETSESLLANNTSVLQPAAGAGQIQPRPWRNFIVGGLLGAMLGLGLAFLAEALDRRVRNGEEIGAALDLPLLGRLARPPRRLRKRMELVMLAEPASAGAEAFRKLRTSIELANRKPRARTIMFTSAEQRDGKSTAAANVAIAFARAGRRVALVDLDVRRPSLHSFFHLVSNRGITDVVFHRENVAGVIEQVALPAAYFPAGASNGQPAKSSNSSNGRSDLHGVLHVLPCGTIPSAEAEFLESDRVSAVLAELGEAFDIVIVDSPPLLAVGGAMSLSTKVDAIVLVTKFGIRRPILQELGRQLDNANATTLGYILTGVTRSQGYGYGAGYGSYSYGFETKSQRGRQPA